MRVESALPLRLACVIWANERPIYGSTAATSGWAAGKLLLTRPSFSSSSRSLPKRHSTDGDVIVDGISQFIFRHNYNSHRRSRNRFHDRRHQLLLPARSITALHLLTRRINIPTSRHHRLRAKRSHASRRKLPQYVLISPPPHSISSAVLTLQPTTTPSQHPAPPSLKSPTPSMVLPTTRGTLSRVISLPKTPTA